MTTQDAPAPPLLGCQVDRDDSARLLRLVGLFLRPGEAVAGLATAVNPAPALTHVAVTDRRVLGFAAADLAKVGPCRTAALAETAAVEARVCASGRRLLVLVGADGARTEFGEVPERDADALLALVRARLAPPPEPLPAPPAGAPSWRWATPPGWPVPPAGWTPPAGWRPDPSWPPPPAGWQFWVADGPPPVPAPRPVPPAALPIPQPIPQPVPQPVPPVPAPSGGERRPMFGGRRQRIEELEAENARLTAELARLGLLEPMRLAAEVAGLREQAAATRAEADAHEARLTAARREIVETRDVALLQEAGVYEYEHPLADAVAYKARLAEVKDEIKALARQGRAVVGSTSWSVNGSHAQGRTMVKDFSKLMLRAFNAEADNLVRTMRPYKLQSALDRLDRTAQTIERLGRTMDIRVSAQYREVRRRELRLTADHLAKVDEERERVRAERERQREEEKARKEYEREKARLLKERSHVESALARLEAKGDAAGAAELRERLDDVESALTSVEGRAANTRAGYVYVISNLGAFGPEMVKIGMTRRLEPMDRVRELGDASVPFRFDVHALIFSDDAVALETRLHREFAERRVNRVNTRREFFYATPAEVRDVLARVAGNHLVEYRDVPEAPEFRASPRPREG
ncbi:DUF4041 domain-containing protein [Actinomadura atramentaria]|uniref:DUF4041 domain-containing protein n=1 Tax=Actinomadura atramentaria TaxID=1990 RepID=UPI000377C907|nr:DUF4041 domain-containing protein [Actinomadura atramentaria]